MKADGNIRTGNEDICHCVPKYLAYKSVSIHRRNWLCRSVIKYFSRLHLAPMLRTCGTIPPLPTTSSRLHVTIVTELRAGRSGFDSQEGQRFLIFHHRWGPSSLISNGCRE